MKVDLHRKYVRRCLLAIAAFSAGVFSIGWYVEPFSGDLARMGGYAERDFGWNGTQQGYPRPRFSLGAYEGYWDVVVLGDSFSFNESPFQWQNFFVATTGLSVITLDLRGGSPDAVLGSKAFRQHPPKLFIFESIERNLRQHLSHASSACPDLPRQTVRELQFARRPDESVAIKREHPLRSYLSHGYPLALLYRAVHRSVADEQKQAVRRFSLTRSDLFSSRSSDQLLVYEEVHGKPWSDAQVTEIRCGLRELRRRVEQNGITHFIAMVVPDRLTAYSDYVTDGQVRHLSRLADLTSDEPLTPGLLVALRQAIDAGTVDVYQPDDTHWGSAGHQIAARLLVDTINGQRTTPARELSASAAKLRKVSD